MQYDEFVELAHICARQAIAMTEDVARAFWLMAVEYQAKAATLGKKPDIGGPPP